MPLVFKSIKLSLVNSVCSISQLMADFSKSSADDEVLGDLIIEQARRVSYLNCSFNFVTSEYPYFDSSVLQTNNCLLNIVLELSLIHI